jgi:hypothetical protein
MDYASTLQLLVDYTNHFYELTGSLIEGFEVNGKTYKYGS